MTVKIRYKKLTKGYCSVFLDIHNGASRFSEFLGIKFKMTPGNPREREEKRSMLKLAETLASQRKVELLQGQHGIEEEYNTNIDFITYAKAFIANHPVKDTRKYYAALKKLTAFAGRERIACFEITESFLRKFVQYLDQRLKGEACHNYFSKLKQIITAATKDYHFRVNPTAEIKVRKHVFLHKDVLNYDEIRLLADTPLGNKEIKQAFLFCCMTGLRHCDVKVLLWKNVRSEILHVIQAKTKIPVTIPLNADALDLLPERLAPDELVFKLPSHAGCQKWLKIWAKNAGIEKHLTWHSSRHSFGTNLIAHGVDVSIASKLLGHTSLVHTQRYVKINDELKAKAIAQLPAIKMA